MDEDTGVGFVVREGDPMCVCRCCGVSESLTLQATPVEELLRVSAVSLDLSGIYRRHEGFLLAIPSERNEGKNLHRHGFVGFRSPVGCPISRVISCAVCSDPPTMEIILLLNETRDFIIEQLNEEYVLCRESVFDFLEVRLFAVNSRSPLVKYVRTAPVEARWF